MKIYDIFHPNLLWKAVNNLLPGQHNAPPLPIVSNDEEKWEVDNILDAKHEKGRKLLFQVK